MARVAAVQRDIRDGRVFECCLTRRLELELQADPWRLYGKMRANNTAHFGAWLTCGDVAVLCSSPERFLVSTATVGSDAPDQGHPAQQSRPYEDTALHDELAASPKTAPRTSHDRGPGAQRPGTRLRDGGIEVLPELMAVELCGWCGRWSRPCAAACARAGRDRRRARLLPRRLDDRRAPKIEAMKRIDELEPWSRGVYAGSGLARRRGRHGPQHRHPHVGGARRPRGVRGAAR
ncbi:MAG: chorismate-binding protein [bacterium]|nr:chorismate-binding protein [bacterium]